MAISTPDRRSSSMLTPGEMTWTPSGVIVAADRLPMLEFYSGFIDDDGSVNYLRGVFWCEPFFDGDVTTAVELSGNVSTVEELGGKVMAN